MPRVATNGTGRWIVVWESGATFDDTIGADRDVLYAVSDDDGASGTEARALNKNAATDGERHDFAPRIHSDAKGNWIVAWHNESFTGDALAGAFEKDVLMACSSDGGETWSDPAFLTDSMTSDTGNDTLASLASDPAGRWMVAWQSTEKFGTDPGNDDDILVSRYLAGLGETAIRLWNVYE